MNLQLNSRKELEVADQYRVNDELIFNEADYEDEDDQMGNSGDGNDSLEEEPDSIVNERRRGKERGRGAANLSGINKDERLKKICAYCERNKCVYFCDGPCKRAFHEECRKRVNDSDAVCGLDNNLINFDINEAHLDDERIKKLMKEDFICKNCKDKEIYCFKCKKKGKISLREGRNRKKGANEKQGADSSTGNNATNDKGSPILVEDDGKEEELGNEKEDANEPVKEDELYNCLTTNCNKYYHLSCLVGNKLVKYSNEKKTKFRCPLHYCLKCFQSGDSNAIAQCCRCPTSYHLKCYPKDKVLKLTKKTLICQVNKIN